MNRNWLVPIFAALVLPPAYSQVSTITCTANVAAPLVVRAGGEAELVGDLVLRCSNSGPSQSLLVNIQLFLNVNLTSRIMNPAIQQTEALLLIDEPQPGVPNISNGFPYAGQVAGAAGVHAGAPGSGNVYEGKLAGGNSVAWIGVPYVTGGVRTFRITNIRANTAPLGGGGPVQSFITLTGPFVSAPVINVPLNTLAFVTPGLIFSSAVTVSAPGLSLKFTEGFPSAFKKRIENTIGGPVTAVHQDAPGAVFCTESGFTPEFSGVGPGAIGSANTGTRLLAQISNIPPVVFALTVPNQVVSSSGNLVAHRVMPPFGSNYAGGAPSLAAGTSNALVTVFQTAEILYEVTAAAPFAGRNGCATIDTLNLSAIPSFPVSLAGANVKGRLAPVDPTPNASATAPDPRFVP
jgi:hypothetical protein